MNAQVQTQPRITIDNAAPVTKEGDFKNDAGESIKYSTTKQSARLDVGGFAYPYEIRLEKDQKPYPAGEYEFDWAGTLEVSKKNLNLAKYPRLRLISAAK